MNAILERPSFRQTVRRRIDAEHSLHETMKKAIDRLHVRVDIKMDAETVVVTGEVESWYDKQMVQETLRPLAVDRVVYNELIVA